MQIQIPYNLYRNRYKYKYLTLYHALRDAILNGTLPYRSKLPSSRELAESYQISRGIVAQVYDMLAAEGFLTSKVGQGTFVFFDLHEHAKGPEQEQTLVLSAWGRRLDDAVSLPHARHAESEQADIVVDFGIYYASMEQFPRREWNRALYRSVRELTDPTQQAESDAQGVEPLRMAIAQHLRRARGIEAEVEDIAIVNGSMQAIALLVQLLSDPGDVLVAEDPGFNGIQYAVAANGAKLQPAPVDEQGIQVADWSASLLYVTPGRQFPTGAVLSLERRQELLKWAARRNAVVIEDDYDSEFRFHGRPVEPLKTLDKNGRVVYIGTFSKTMFHDIRIGYVVLPAWLREPFAKAQHLFEPHPASLIQQRALAEMMNSGVYERHLRRMKRLYGQRQKLCLAELRSQCGDWFNAVDSNAGLHVFAWWKQSAELFDLFLQQCLEHGIRVTDSSEHQFQVKKRAALFGFAHLQEDEMRWAFRTMREILIRLTDRGGKWNV